MLERPFLPAGHEPAAPDDALRMPAWSDLAARFAALHDLRRTLGESGAVPGGGFARFSATDPQELNVGRVDVNLTGLAHGKPGAGKLSPADGSFPEADRETP